MADYYLTVFDRTGKKTLDESFAAANNVEAKELGLKRLEELELSEDTHRCVTADGKLVLFHR